MTTRSRQWTLRANYGFIEVIRCLPRLQVSGSFMWEVSHKLWELLRSKRWDRRWTRESHSFVSLMYKPDSKCCANSRSKRFGLMGRKGLWLDVFFFEGVKKATSPPLLFDFLDLHNTNEKYSMTNCSRIVASCQVARPSFNAFKIERSLPSWELTSPPTMALLFEDSMIFRTSRLGEWNVSSLELLYGGLQEERRRELQREEHERWEHLRAVEVLRERSRVPKNVSQTISRSEVQGLERDYNVYCICTEVYRCFLFIL